MEITPDQRLRAVATLYQRGYDKEVLTTAGIRTKGVSETTLYNPSATVGLTDRTAVFGSWMTGLEEAGVAPTSAIDRDDVLPPVEAKQFELGLRHAITPGLTVIGAVFDVPNPRTVFARTDRLDWWEVRIELICTGTGSVESGSAKAPRALGTFIYRSSIFIE